MSGDSVCHGDFHPDNVMMTADGPVLIDWPGATRGVPEADFARTLLLMTTASLPPHVSLLRRGLVNALRALYTRTYRRAYPRLTGVSQEQVQAWMLPVCAARFDDNILEDEPALRRLMTRLIARL